MKSNKTDLVKVGVIIPPFIDHKPTSSLIDLVLKLNTIQGSLEFQILPNTNELESEFPPGLQLKMEDLQRKIPEKLSRYRKAQNFSDTFPIAILASTSFSNNVYVVGDGTWAAITLHHWIERDGYEIANLLFASRLIRSSITFAGVLGLTAHTSTVSCIFDYTKKIDDAQYSLRSGFVCADCTDIVTRCTSQAFAGDVKVLLAAVADKYDKANIPATGSAETGNDDDGGQKSGSTTANVVEHVRPFLDYLFATSFRRALTTVMGFGVVLLANFDWPEVVAYVFGTTINQPGDRENATITFAQWVGFGALTTGFIGHLWLHVTGIRKEAKIASAELLGELLVLIRAYEDTPPPRPGGYYSPTIKNCRALAIKFSSVAPTSFRKDPTLRKLMDARIDASGKDPLFDSTVNELRKFAEELDNTL